MSDLPAKPNLTLAQPPGRLQSSAGGSLPSGLRGLILMQLFLLIWLGWKVHQGSGAPTSSAATSRISAHLRTTAIALEDRGLVQDAASVWREYLAASVEPTDQAEVLYRIGRLSIEANDYHQAARALIEAEQLIGDNESLRNKVGQKIVECLRRLGQFGEVGRELSRQTEPKSAAPSSQAKVLASFAGENFTDADLDRTIERQVDRMLAMQPEGFGISRDQLLKQFQSPELRQRTFQEVLQLELFSRRARELKLDREEPFQRSRDFLETELLGQAFLKQELKLIHPTDVDLQSYYAANLATYRQPEAASVVTLALPTDVGAADELLLRIQSADDLRKLADEANGEAKLTPLRISAGSSHPLLGDVKQLFELKAGEWTKTPFQGTKEKMLVLLESKTPATSPSLTEIRTRVESDYRQRKQEELTQRLFADLTSRYDVKILAMPGTIPSANAPTMEPTPTPGAAP